MGFKPMILGTGILHSIQLNYGANIFVTANLMNIFDMSKYLIHNSLNASFILPNS